MLTLLGIGSADRDRCYLAFHRRRLIVWKKHHALMKLA